MVWSLGTPGAPVVWEGVVVVRPLVVVLDGDVEELCVGVAVGVVVTVGVGVAVRVGAGCWTCCPVPEELPVLAVVAGVCGWT